jgi:hypothetical protein
MEKLFNKSFLVIAAFLTYAAFSVGGCGDIETQLSSIDISPANATIGVNQPQQFSAAGKDSSGKYIQVTPTWNITGNIGPITSNGLFTAGSTPGSGVVTATSGSVTGETNLTVTENGWIEGRVQDEIGQRVQGIKIYLRTTSLFEFTASDGTYTISQVPAGIYSVIATDPRGIYKDASLEAVSVASGETVLAADFVIYYFTRPPDTTPPTF